jgi:UDP-GlcNAc:undecaprenyl-phosphate GlcNAc-1-phosphate transferase
LWLWAAVAAFGSVSFVFLDARVAAAGVLGMVLVAVVLTVWLPRWAPPGRSSSRAT